MSVQVPDAPAQEMSPRRQWAALAVLLLPVLIIAIDNTVLGFAVPELSESLSPSSSQLLWIVDSYGFVLAGLLVTMGHLGDRIGRRRLLLLGATGFGAASVLAAFSTSAGMLIASRALLGVAGATLMPSTLSLIRNIFLDDARRRTAIGLWTSGFAVGSALGPIAGGWLLEHYWWGSVFLMALPVMALLLVVGPFLLPESRHVGGGHFDLASSPLSLAAILPIIYALKTLAEHGPTLEVACFIAVGATFGWFFVRRQRRIDDPMLDVTLFVSRPFSMAITTNLIANFSLIGAMFLIAQYLQLVVGLEPLAAGLHLLPAMIAAGTASVGVVALTRKRLPLRVVLVGALTTAGLGYVSLAALGTDSALHLALSMTLVGLGVGGASSLGANLVMATVPAQRAGSASAVSETAFELGAAMGIALLGSTVNAIYRRSIDLPDGLDPTVASEASDTIARAVEIGEGLDPATGAAVIDAAQQAFTSGMNGAGLLGASLLLLIAGTASRVLRVRPTAKVG